ncbi:hypothetical protein ACT4_006_00450 [Acinetobacter sp. NBRC 100985]|nr:hypothetical protein ACT4_006_00450 [Acinetobacter sp. NBRC 100985]
MNTGLFYFDNRVITILIKKKPNIEMLNGESKRFKRDKNNKIAAFFDIAVQFKINKKIQSLILKISS